MFEIFCIATFIAALQFTQWYAYAKVKNYGTRIEARELSIFEAASSIPTGNVEQLVKNTTKVKERFKRRGSRSHLNGRLK